MGSNSSKSGSDPLPKELWGEVGKRVESRLDVKRFRSVCKSWRSILPSPTLFPLNIPPPFASYPYNTPGVSLVPWFIMENSVYAVAGVHSIDTNPELVVLEDIMGHQGNKFLQSHLSRFGEFDDYGCNCDFDCWSKINLLNNQVPVTPLTKYYHIRSVNPDFDEDGNRVEGKCCLRINNFTKIALVSNCTCDDYNPSYVTDHSKLAFVALSHYGDLAVLRNHGQSEWEWENFPRPQGATDQFDDIVSHKGRLYVVDSEGMTFVMDDFKSMKMTQIGSYGQGFFTDSFRVAGNYRRRFVVEGTGRNGDLYMVVLGRVKKNSEKVFKLVQTHGWLEVSNLGNQAFFVGRHFSFTIPDAGTTISSNVINSIFIDDQSFDGYIRDNRCRRWVKYDNNDVLGDAFKLAHHCKQVDEDDDDPYCAGYSVGLLHLGRNDPSIEVTATSSANSASSIISRYYESSYWRKWVNYRIFEEDRYWKR